MTEKLTELQKIADQMQAHQRELVTAALILTAAAAGVIAYRAVRTRRDERARAGRSTPRGSATRKAGASRRGSAPRKSRAKSSGGRARANGAAGSASTSAATH